MIPVKIKWPAKPGINKSFALGRLKTGEMNATERRYDEFLALQQHTGEILWRKFEGIKLRLADNTFYSPDFAVMTPLCLISTAALDIARKAENRTLQPGSYNRFGFDPRDVRHNDTPADVLRRALKRARRKSTHKRGATRVRGAKAGQRKSPILESRERLYADRRVLRMAIRMAEARL